MGKATERCEHCDATLVQYKHGLSMGIVIALSRLARHARVGELVDLNDISITHTQICNFQKLKYWGLVEKASLEGNSKGGVWKLTQEGADFVAGDLALPKYVWTFRGKVVRFEGESVTIDIVAEGYKYRPQYAKEAKPFGSTQEQLPL